MAESKYVVFKVADEFYGISIEAVERILPEQSVTRLPKTPKMFLGIFDLRGETVPTIDLRLRFEQPESTETSNFVVVLSAVGRVALRVDSVDGIATFDEASIEANPELFDQKGDDFVFGIAKMGDRLVALLNSDEVVPKNLRSQVQKASKGKAA